MQPHKLKVTVAPLIWVNKDIEKMKFFLEISVAMHSFIITYGFNLSLEHSRSLKKISAPSVFLILKMYEEERLKDGTIQPFKNSDWLLCIQIALPGQFSAS